MRQSIIFIFSLAISLVLVSCDNNDNPKNDQHKHYSLFLVDDNSVYDKGNHAAFTALVNFQGELYLAFREGNNHVPTNKSEYGRIIVHKYINEEWKQIASLSDPNMDLRDPYFLIVGNSLRLYSGYNESINGIWQHITTVYSELKDNQWSSFVPITHDVSHNIWLWKARSYNGSFYGIGFLENHDPVFLSSSDGNFWKTVTVLAIPEEGVYTEADVCFLKDSVFVCIRNDVPKGSPGWWGKSEVPFTKFQWKKLGFSIDSPEIRCFDNGQLFLAGREWIIEGDNPISMNQSFYEMSHTGDIINKWVLWNNEIDPILRFTDMAYPSMAIKMNNLFLSYYQGYVTTEVRVAKFRIIED